MPYFIFQINNHREYILLSQQDNYRSARQQVRSLRAAENSESGVVNFRMIFAETPEDGKQLLKTRRDKQPGEDNF